MDLENAAKALEASGRYRVLRRIPAEKGYRFASSHGISSSTIKRAAFVDVETTGLKSGEDEIIELAMVKFSYTVSGQILEIEDTFRQLQEPSRPIPSEVTQLTGLDAAAVAGHRIDWGQVETNLRQTPLVIAHNAIFDRPFLERACEAFRDKSWACSMQDVDWGTEGFEGTKLSYLVAGAGFFYDRHRALNDCLAAVTLLANALPKSGTLAMARLLERARAETRRVWAIGAPFGRKDLLKERGYRWNADGAGEDRPARTWYIDLRPELLAAELAFLEAEVYGRAAELKQVSITAKDRYSDRC